MAEPSTQTVKGDLLKIDGEDGTFKAGDKIEAQATEKNHALSINKLVQPTK